MIPKRLIKTLKAYAARGGLKVNIQFFPIGWQNPQNQYFLKVEKKVRQIPLFRTSHNSGLEGPNSKISKPIQALAITFQAKKN